MNAPLTQHCRFQFNIPRTAMRVASFASLFLLCRAASGADEALQCEVDASGERPAVVVRMPTPHAREMTIVIPDGRTIWLQADHIPFQWPQTDEFDQLAEFVLDDQARGSWFNDWGEPEAVSLLSGAGTYVLFLGDDLESGNDGGVSYTCKFSLVPGNASRQIDSS